MKTKITLILFLLMLFVMEGKVFAQVQINAPSSYQPLNLVQGGAEDIFKVDIINNSATALNGATFSLSLPAGMEYVSGTIAGANQLNITNLQNPTFTLNVPVGNTQPITFSARINCGYSSGVINYSVISGGTIVANGSSAVAGNTPAPAYVFSSVPNPQALSTPLNTNATRTIKFKNTGNAAVSTVYFESNVVTASYYPYYKLVTANYGTVTTVTNGYRITLTGAALKNAITTSVGTADASFDADEEITIVLTEQITSCAVNSNIALNMKAGSGDSKNSFCFFDSSTASIFTPVSNAAISLTRLTGTTFPDFCTNGKVSYTITNTGVGASSSLFNIKLPWSTSYYNSGIAPLIEPEYIALKKVFINGNDVTSLVLTRNGTGSAVIVPGLGNCFVIDLGTLTNAYGTSLQSLDGDGKYDDLLVGQSFQIDFEYAFDAGAFRNCNINSANMPNSATNYFTLGTSYINQCGARSSKTNYDSGIITDYTKATFQLGGQLNNSFSASLSQAALYPGNKVNLSTNLTASFSRAFVQTGKILKTFTLVLPDGLDYDASVATKCGGTIVPTTSISYNASTKTLVLTPAANLPNINSSNDVLEIPLVVTGTGVVTNKVVQYSATFGFVGCAVTAPYGCNSVELNYSIINGSCPTVGTTSFDMTRNTFGYVPAPSNTNVWYMPTAFVNETSVGINLHGAVSKDQVKTTFKGTVNSTSFAELWARVKYTSNAATNSSNFDKLTANTADVAGTITIIKASDGSTVSGNITVGDIEFTTDAVNNLQIQQVNLGVKIGVGKEINYTLQVGDQIIVNWLTKVSRDNLSYVYGQLRNLEGDLYTKDSAGTASGCQAIPLGFSIQRLYLIASQSSGTQSVVGTNGLRVSASIFNGHYITDANADHFPNEVRNYGVFRSLKATLPGIWILDTSVTKEPTYATANQVVAYKIDPSLFSVNYSGGNTIVTLNNSALGSNGIPLSTASLPVVADCVGTNGTIGVFFNMLPTCVTSGNITTNIVQNYDIYTTEADNSITESYPITYSQGGSGITYYNHTANAAPTLQNVDGVSSIVKWQVRVVNTSDTAAITAAGGNASLPNNWMSFVSLNNNITVTKLIDITTGTEYPAVAYSTGKYWVKLGNIATSATYDVEATYTTCANDKLQCTYSFGATGYPVDPDRGYGDTIGVCAASESEFVLNLFPKDVNLTMQVTSPPNPIQFCNNDISVSGENLINYTLNVTNVATGNAEGLVMEAVFPDAYTARTGTSKITNNGVTKTIGDPVYNSAKGVWQWNISLDPNGIVFLPGVSSGQNVMKLDYQGETQCGFASGSAVSYNMKSTSGCGKLIEYSVTGTSMDLSMRPASLNPYSLTSTLDVLKNDGSGSVYKIEVKNQGSLPLNPNERVFVTLPASIDYVPDSLVLINGASNVSAPLTNIVIGPTRLLTFPLPVGANGVTLLQNEIASFNIEFKIINANLLSCGTITGAIKLETIYSVPSAMCGTTSCPVNVITGSAKSDANIIKTSLAITPGTSIARFESITNNDVTVKYTVSNTGAIANNTPIVVDFFADLNKDGIYTIGEPILYTQTISGSSATIAVGATSTEQTTAVFSMLESSMCNITAAIRTSNNAQICTESTTLIPVGFESAQTIFAVCGKSDVTIGNLPNGAIVSWSPTTYLSDSNISNPVFNYTGTPVTVKADLVYTATITHPGGCSNTFTNTVTINPDPSVIITNPATVCEGTTVDLTAASITAGSDASLTYTYFTDAAGTISLVDKDAVTEPDTYYIKGTNADGCYTIKPVVVTVNPLPTASLATTGPVCQNEAVAPIVTFTGANGTPPYTFTYKINNGSNLTVSTISGNSVNISAPTGIAGSYVYSLVDVKDSSSTTCLRSQTGTATVVINPLPTAAVSGTTAVCIGAAAQDITFTGAGGIAPYTFTYKLNGGIDQTVTTVAGNSVIVSTAADTAGSFVYSLVGVSDSSSTACTQLQTGTATITINSFPTASITGATVVCSGATSPNVTFTGADGIAPYTFTYNVNGAADQTVTTTNGNSVTVAASTSLKGDFDYTLVKVKDGSSSACEQLQTGTVTITVEPLPTATITGTTAVCKNDEAPNVTFTGSGGTTPYTFTYKLNGGTNQTISTTGGSIAIIEAPTGTTGSFVYTLVSVKDANGAACEQLQTGEVTITVNPLPSASILGTITVCKNATAPDVTFTGTGGTAPYTFTYNINGGTDQTVTTTNGNSVTVAAATNATGSFVYNLISVSDGSSSACEQLQTGDATITVNPLPTAAISGTTSVCKGTSAQDITFTGAGGTAPYTFIYNVNGGSDQAVTTTIGNSVTVGVSTNIAGSFVYNLISVQDSGSIYCIQAQTGTATITVSPLPSVVINNPAAVCSGATVDLTASTVTTGSTVNLTYDYFTDVLGTTVLLTPNAISVSGTYYIRGTSTSGCSAIQPAVVTVNPLPILVINNPAAVCSDTTVDLTVSSVTVGSTIGLNYSYFTDALGTTVLSFPNAVSVSGTYYIKGTSASGCLAIQPVIVTINSVPTLVIKNPAAVCSGATVDLTAPAVTAGSTTGLTYNYFTDNLGTTVLSNPNTVTVRGTYYIKGTSVNGCSDIQPVIVTINPLLALVGTPSTLCAKDGSGYVLTLTVTGQEPYTATGTGAPGTWSGNTWTSSIISAGTNYNVSVEDAYACNTVVIADTAPICCMFEVVCPTFSTTTVTCYDQIPTATKLTVSEFEALGNGDGVIGNAPCGVIEITASNGEAPKCDGTIIRTYTITEYADTNNNKIRDNDENTILNSSVCTQNFTINKSDFVMPANAGSTVACAASIIAPTVPVVTDNCGNVLTPSPAVISVIPACNGNETYTYTFTDCEGNAHDWIYTYTVDNTIAPTGTVPANLILQCIADVPVANINAVTNTKSNCNGTTTVTVADTNNGGTGCKGNPYIVARTYTLTDCSGLSTNLVQTITVTDTTAPVFVEVLPENITVDCSAAVPAAVTLNAIDNCSIANVTYNEVRIDGTCYGNYQLQRTWIAADICGNTVAHNQIITVQDTTAPIFVQPLPVAVVNADCETIPAPAILTATDNCGTATVVYNESRVDGNCSNDYTLLRTWVATDNCSNQNSFTQTVKVSCLANVYNALSPNGDGKNDTFVIQGIDCYPNNSVKIFNRYGAIVYEKDGYDNVTNVFEGFSDGRGTFKRGDKLPTGTYFYTLQYDNNGNRVEKSGYLYISNQ